ncbi:uncharacterized protein [Magallana gigas]|uniref:uncharacterized protein isoform X3 n=1 Tax=Magallana gigas TaxID=29159 RepID=UPI00333E3068
MFLVCHLFLVYLQQTQAVCTFPTDMVGSWHVSDFGGAVIQRKTLTTEKSVVNFGTRIFECTLKEDNRYLLTSDVFNFYGSPFQLGLCWEFQKVSETQYIYYAAMGALSISQCPLIMQANFTYTYDFGNGNQCTGNTSLDVCSDVTSMEFDYSLCSTEQGYSATGSLTCVHQEQFNELVYLIVFNNDIDAPDEVTRFRFTCYVMQQQKGGLHAIQMTQYPQACLDKLYQTPYRVVRPGAHLQLQRSSKDFCTGRGQGKGQSVDSVVSAVAAIGAVFGTIVLSLSIVIGVKLYHKFKKHSIQPARSESVSSLASFDRVQSMFSLDGRISPFSLRPTLSEIAYKRFGSSMDELDYMNDETDDQDLFEAMNDNFIDTVESSFDQSYLRE